MKGGRWKIHHFSGVHSNKDIYPRTILLPHAIWGFNFHTEAPDKPNLILRHAPCYTLIQRFRVTGLFAGQYTTGYYGTFTDVIVFLLLSDRYRNPERGFEPGT